MGYGFRTDFINKKEKENFPSPGQYNFNSLFAENINKHRGYSLSQRIPYKVIIKQNQSFEIYY